MFDTMKIAQRIKGARIEKNMTQMTLADAMGVSYQAVSNWERGNSMPDISKLGDLCEVLGISVNDLLGIEAPAVTKALEKLELTQEELAEVAPVLPPVEVKACAEKVRRKKKLNLSSIMSMVAFLDQNYLEELVSEAQVDDLDDVVAVAPFLSQGTVDALVQRCSDVDDFDCLPGLAPFVSQGTLEELASMVDVDDLEDVVCIAPFLSREAVDGLVKRCADMDEFESLTALAPFISQETLDMLVERYVEIESDEDLSGIYPFLSKQAMRKLVEYMISRDEADEVRKMAVFL